MYIVLVLQSSLHVYIRSEPINCLVSVHKITHVNVYFTRTWLNRTCRGMTILGSGSYAVWRTRVTTWGNSHRNLTKIRRRWVSTGRRCNLGLKSLYYWFTIHYLTGKRKWRNLNWVFLWCTFELNFTLDNLMTNPETFSLTVNLNMNIYLYTIWLFYSIQLQTSAMFT